MKVDAQVKRAVREIPQGVLVLRFTDIEEEFRWFKDVVLAKVEPVSLRRLDKLIAVLHQIAGAAAGSRVIWSTADGPLKTVPSGGRHQMGRAGHGRNLYGEVSFNWEVELCGIPNGRRPLSRLFALRNSSVRISLKDVDEDLIVASWDFDVGDNQSPGCHFHAKFSPFSASDADALVDVDVPRLPSIIFMPTDALEFVIGELWQEEWREIAASTATPLLTWRRFPRHRLLQILSWYLEEVKEARGTPWAHLKRAKPDRLFLWEGE